MTSPREEIFSRLRRSLNGRRADNRSHQELSGRLDAPPRNLMPRYTRVDDADAIELFTAMASLSAATLTRVGNWQLVPKEIAAYCRIQRISPEAVVSQEDELKNLPWRDALSMTRFEPPGRNDGVGVSLAYAGIAETGTVVHLSGPDHPISLNLLPENHIAVLPSSRVVACYEDLWEKMGDEFGPGHMPRTVLWVTGPSRTADVGQQMLLGAHGPVREHIIVVKGS